MDGKRSETDQFENPGDVVDAAGEYSPAAAALLSMIANGNDVRAAAAIGLGIMEKQDSLAMKKLPDYPLKLDAVRLKQLQSIYFKQKQLTKQVKVRYKEAKMDYREKIKPLYQRRYEIVAGVTENGKGVPEFWLSALVAIPHISDAIMRWDEQALKYLMNISSHKTKDDKEKSLRLEFTFDKSNPFFENTVLTNVIHWKKYGRRYVIDRIEGTAIGWKKGKCLTERYVLKNGRKEKMKFKSFFGFYSSTDEYAMMAYYAKMAVRIDERILPHAFALYMDAKSHKLLKKTENDGGGSNVTDDGKKPPQPLSHADTFPKATSSGKIPLAGDANSGDSIPYPVHNQLYQPFVPQPEPPVYGGGTGVNFLPGPRRYDHFLTGYGGLPPRGAPFQAPAPAYGGPPPRCHNYPFQATVAHGRPPPPPPRSQNYPFQATVAHGRPPPPPRSQNYPFQDTVAYRRPPPPPTDPYRIFQAPAPWGANNYRTDQWGPAGADQWGPAGADQWGPAGADNLFRPRSLFPAYADSYRYPAPPPRGAVANILSGAPANFRPIGQVPTGFRPGGWNPAKRKRDNQPHCY